jgi:hypothetical protein
MAKKLSEHLADLSVRAKKTEDAVSAAQTEAHEKLMARREQARAAATAAVEKVNQDVKSVGDTAARKLSAVKAKIAADMDTLKAAVAKGKHDLDVKSAEHDAERLEREADFAIDYAIASVEQAGLAAIDAIAGRVNADQVKGAR